MLLVFDITRRDTFVNAAKWLEEVRVHGNNEKTIILVGNKCDLEEKRVVSQWEAEDFAK